jgi:hypothetical protein
MRRKLIFPPCGPGGDRNDGLGGRAARLFDRPFRQVLYLWPHRPVHNIQWIPRGEGHYIRDFGPTGRVRRQGVAVPSWID